jgi:hypothetical protein
MRTRLRERLAAILVVKLHQVFGWIKALHSGHVSPSVWIGVMVLLAILLLDE